MGFSFTIAQDIHNLSLLNEIKSYFNDRGEVFELSKQCNIYKSGKKSDLISVILPKILNKESLEGDFDNLFLPFMKGYKIYFTCKILELLKNSTLDKSTFHEVLRFSYHISRKSDNLTFKDYVKSSYDDLLLALGQAHSPQPQLEKVERFFKPLTGSIRSGRANNLIQREK